MKQSKIKNIILSIILATLYACFFVFLILVLCKYNFKIDKFIPYIAKHRTKFATNYFKIITYAGSIYFLILVVLLFLIFTKNKKDGLFAACNLICASAFCVIIKYIVRRVRPQNVTAIVETGFSFPSAHAMLSVAVFAVLIYFAFKYLKNKPLKICLAIALTCLTFVVIYTRAYLGVHFVSDLLAGFVFGLALTITNILIYNKFLNRKKYNDYTVLRTVFYFTILI